MVKNIHRRTPKPASGGICSVHGCKKLKTFSAMVTENNTKTKINLKMQMLSMEGLNFAAKVYVPKQVALLETNIQKKEYELLTMIEDEIAAPCRNLGCYCVDADLGKPCPFLSSFADDDDNNEEDDDDVWTDIDSDEEEEEEEEEPCNCHEVLHKPLFSIPTESMICECVICFDTIEAVNMMITRCGHSFHASCCIESLKENDGCPLCRTQLVN